MDAADVVVAVLVLNAADAVVSVVAPIVAVRDLEAADGSVAGVVGVVVAAAAWKNREMVHPPFHQAPSCGKVLLVAEVAFPEKSCPGGQEEAYCRQV